jgi:hypothetical protein
VVTHTILPHDGEIPGMGVVFDCDDRQREQLVELMNELEQQMQLGRLPTNAAE